MGLLVGDCVASMASMGAGSARCCITSPPYWGLRDYGHDGQLGLEETPEAYVEKMVEVFREVRRVLADDGTLWLNIGDSYARNPKKGGSGPRGKNAAYSDTYTQAQGRRVGSDSGKEDAPDSGAGHSRRVEGSAEGSEHRVLERGRDAPGYVKEKDLVGIPWRLAFALQADGWYLRQDIIWHKPNPMPESVRDRCTKAHEYVFLLTKSKKYHYDHEAVKEAAECSRRRGPAEHPDRVSTNGNAGLGRRDPTPFRNRRSVWRITTKPFKGAHFAVMPEALVEPCLLAGSAKGDIVLDPFAGAGTVGVVAKRWGREFVGCELNPEYAELAEKRIDAAPDRPPTKPGSLFL